MLLRGSRKKPSFNKWTKPSNFFHFIMDCPPSPTYTKTRYKRGRSNRMIFFSSVTACHASPFWSISLASDSHTIEMAVHYNFTGLIIHIPSQSFVFQFCFHSFSLCSISTDLQLFVPRRTPHRGVRSKGLFFLLNTVTLAINQLWSLYKQRNYSIRKAARA
jgi:hypothetical protein